MKPSEVLKGADTIYNQTFNYDARKRDDGSMSYCTNGILAKIENMRFTKYDTIDAFHISVDRLMKKYGIPKKILFTCSRCNDNEVLNFYGFVAHLNDHHRLYFSEIAEELEKYKL